MTSTPWWTVKRDALLALMAERDAAYVYDLSVVAERAADLRALKSVDQLWYACKANAHPAVLRAVVGAGFGLECVSIDEVRHALASAPGLKPADILFTPNFAPRQEYEAALDFGVRITLDGEHPLTAWPELWRGREIIARFNPDRPRGHHRHVHTAGPRAKFGLPLPDAERFATLAREVGASVVGLHAHAGSGVDDVSHWHELGLVLMGVAKHFPKARVLNLGGGLPTWRAEGLDLRALDASLAALRTDAPGMALWLEPGRRLVADAGVLLARVTQIKLAHGARFIGVATGMNSLIRPALYNAVHPIVNLTRLGAPDAGLASIVGPICESADALGVDRLFPHAEEGDVVLIAEAGAYGAVMSSRYNRRAPAEELILDPAA